MLCYPARMTKTFTPISIVFIASILGACTGLIGAEACTPAQVAALKTGVADVTAGLNVAQLVCKGLTIAGQISAGSVCDQTDSGASAVAMLLQGILNALPAAPAALLAPDAGSPAKSFLVGTATVTLPAWHAEQVTAVLAARKAAAK